MNLIKNLLLILVVTVTTTLCSQDLIITNAGDSINCKITKVTKENIFFNQWSDNQLSQAIISKSQVKNYFLDARTVNNAIEKPKQDISKQKYKLSFYYGMSRGTEKIDTELDPVLQQYERNLQTGNHFGLEGAFFPKEGTGVGLSFCKFRTKNEMRNQRYINNDGDTVTGTFSDDISVVYAGPVIFNRIYSKNRLIIYYLDISMGYLRYNNNFNPYSYTATGNTLGFYSGFGVNFLTSEKFALSIGTKIILGSLKEITLTDGTYSQIFTLDRNEKINLARIDLSFGFSLY